MPIYSQPEMVDMYREAKGEIESLREQVKELSETIIECGFGRAEKEIESLRNKFEIECAAHERTLQNRDEWKRQSENRQAQIDALMLEYCPDDMTPDQIAEYEKNIASRTE